MTSVVYFVLAESVGRLKIGFTEDLEGRLKSLGTSSPFPIRLIGTMVGSRRTEAALHELWKDLRIHGEWFEATDSLMRAVRNALEDEGKRPGRFAGLDPKEIRREERRRRAEFESRRLTALWEFAIYCRDDQECDEEAHRTGVPCRRCGAGRALRGLPLEWLSVPVVSGPDEPMENVPDDGPFRRGIYSECDE